MRNPVDVVHRESTRSRFSCKGMRKQNRLRFGRLSGFQAIVELLNALRILWEAFLPFALLWWNAILCACCARYYSWNRWRFGLECAGHHMLNDPLRRFDVKEVEQGLRHRRSGDISLGEMACDHPISSCGQAMELGWLPEQKKLSLQDLESDDMYADDVCADNIAMDVEKPHNGNKECNTDVCIISCAANGSKSIEVSLRSDASKLSSLHLFSGNIEKQSGLLKAVHWAAHLCLIPTEIPPLAKCEPFGGLDILLEYFWMQLSLHTNKKLLDGKALIQPLRAMCIDLPTLEEHLLVSMMIFVSSILSTFDGKKNVYRARQMFRYMMSKAGFVDGGTTQLISSLSHDNDLDGTRTAVSSETLKGSTDCLSCDLGRRQWPAHLSDLKLKNYFCWTPNEFGLNLENEDGNFFNPGSTIYEALSQPCDGFSCNGVSDICSDLDRIQQQNSRNVCESQQTAVGNEFSLFASSTNHDDEFIESGEAMKFSYESSDLDTIQKPNSRNVCESQQTAVGNEFSLFASSSNHDDVCESQQTAVGDEFSPFASSSNHDDEFSESGEAMKFSYEISKFQNNDGQFSDKPADWDVNGCSQWLEEDDCVWAGYYGNHIVFVRDDTYFQGRLGGDDVGSNCSNNDNGDGVLTNSGQVLRKGLLVDTWWDEDAVLVGEQKQDEDVMDQTWQVL